MTDEELTAQAENERLRALRQPGKSVFPEVVALRERLATATALLETANAPTREWTERYRAFLANQPAAPENKPHRRDCIYEMCAPGCEAALAAEVRQRVAESAVEAKRQVAALSSQPAAPARTDACAHGQVGYCGACRLLDEPVTSKPTRTEAEQAVPDAMAKIPEDSLKWCDGISVSMDAAIAAELARRGLKP